MLRLANRDFGRFAPARATFAFTAARRELWAWRKSRTTVAADSAQLNNAFKNWAKMFRSRGRGRYRTVPGISAREILSSLMTGSLLIAGQHRNGVASGGIRPAAIRLGRRNKHSSRKATLFAIGHKSQSGRNSTRFGYVLIYYFIPLCYEVLLYHSSSMKRGTTDGR